MKRFAVFFEDGDLPHEFEGVFETIEAAAAHIQENNTDVVAENKLTIRDNEWSWHIFEIQKSHHFKTQVQHSVESWEEHQ